MRAKYLSILIVFAALLALPLLTKDGYIRHLFVLTFLFAMVAASWDLTLGYAGIFNFGHIAFFGIGIYTLGILTVKIGVNPWLALPIAGVMSSAAALLVAAPVLRLRGIYVVLVTFAFSQLCLQLVLSQTKLTGGAGGLVMIPPLAIGDYRFGSDSNLGYYYAALVGCAATALTLLAVVNSRLGKAARAVRDNPEYALARGVDQGRTRLIMLVISAAPCGVAGALYCLYFGIAAPEAFGFSNSTFILSMLLVGGVSTILGPVAAAFGVVFLSEYLERFPNVEAAKHMVLAAIIILVLRFFPGGLAQAFGAAYGWINAFVRGGAQARKSATASAKSVHRPE
jgi:branched-chain amino acid transport system permease protein